MPCELTPGVSSPHGLLENAAMKPLANARPGKAGPLLGEAALAPGGSGGGGHSQHPGLPKGSTAGREGGRGPGKKTPPQKKSSCQNGTTSSPCHHVCLGPVTVLARPNITLGAVPPASTRIKSKVQQNPTQTCPLETPWVTGPLPQRSVF